MDCTMMNATETLMKNILAAVAVLLWLEKNAIVAFSFKGNVLQ